MKVIFLQDVRGTAKKNDVKNVSDGFALNYLLPNKLAKAADSKAIVSLEVAKKQEEETDEKLHALAKTISSRELQFFLKTDKKGSVFGSIGKEELLSGLRDSGLVTNDRVEIKIPKPIKELGVHEAEVHLKHGIVAKLKFKVEPKTK